MELKFTPHPFLQPPTDEEIVLLAEKDPKLLEALYLSHEGRLQASEEDPVRYGFDLPGWERMQSSLGEKNEYQGATSCRVGDDAQRVPEEDQEYRGVHKLQYAERFYRSVLYLPGH